MAADFSSILNKPVGSAPKRPVLAAGHYPGVITKVPELLPAPAGKSYQHIIRVTVKPTRWPEDVDDADKVQVLKDGTTIPIDLTRVSLRRDYYSPDGLDQLDQLFLDAGVEDAEGRNRGEVLPELLGKHVLIEVGQYVSTKNNEIGNQVNALRELDR